MVAAEILAFVLEHGGTGWNKIETAVAGRATGCGRSATTSCAAAGS